MNSGFVALSAAGKVAVHDVDGSSRETVAVAQSMQVTAVAWSPDNSVLAVATLGKVLTIVLFASAAQWQVVETILLDVVEARGIRCLCVGEGARMLWFGGDSMLVRAYDRAQRKLVCAFKGLAAPVSSMALNVANSHIAAGSSAGQLLLFNTTTGAATALTTATTQEITCVQFSLHKKRGLLVAGSDDGKVRLWETQDSTAPVLTFDAVHVAPVKGVAFSPMNSNLLLSAGLDKRLVIYNLEKRAPVKTVHTPEQLTSLSFKYSTTSNVVAVGSTAGTVYLYDLQSLAAPVMKLALFASGGDSVQSLAFQFTPGLAAVAAKAAAAAAAATTSSSSSSSVAPTPRDGKPPLAYSVPSTPSTSVLSNKPAATATATAAKPPASTSTISKNRLAPLVTSTPAAATGFAPSLLSATATPSSAFPLIATGTPSSSTSNSPSPSPSPSPAAPPASRPPNPPSTVTITSTTVDASSQTQLRQVVEEALQSFRASIHNDMQNIHLEILRQFHQQKLEMFELIKQSAPNQALLDELRELREENRRLRHMY